MAKDAYHALQVGVTRPFTQGLLLKGHYTLSRSMALRTDYEVPTPKPRIATGRWPTAIGLTPSRWRSCTSCHGGARAARARAQPIDDWQLNGIVAAFSGSPFTVTADGTSLNTPGNTQRFGSIAGGRSTGG